MTDTATEIDLPRFSRRIGVTGLDQSGGDAEPRPVGVLRPFAGILDARISPERVDGSIPPLAYLTLAPLVGRALASGRHTDSDRRDGFDHAATGGTVSEVGRVRDEGDKGDTTDEPTVATVLRTTSREPPTEMQLTPVTRDVSTTPTLDRTLRRLGDPPATANEGSYPSGSAGRHADVGPAEFDSTDPHRTVVTQSQPQGDAGERGHTSDQDETNSGDAEPTVREVLRETDRRQSNTAAPGSDGSDEVGTVNRFDVDSGPSASRSADRPAWPDDEALGETVDDRVGSAEPVGTVVTPQGGDREASADRTGTQRTSRPGTTTGTGPRSRPGVGATPLTVRQSNTAVQRSEAAQNERPAGTPMGRRHPEPGATEQTGDPPTAIAADGSVNERVLDRLYEELRRKERIERDREGR